MSIWRAFDTTPTHPPSPQAFAPPILPPNPSSHPRYLTPHPTPHPTPDSTLPSDGATSHRTAHPVGLNPPRGVFLPPTHSSPHVTPHLPYISPALSFEVFFSHPPAFFPPHTSHPYLSLYLTGILFFDPPRGPIRSARNWLAALESYGPPSRGDWPPSRGDWPPSRGDDPPCEAPRPDARR